MVTALNASAIKCVVEDAFHSYKAVSGCIPVSCVLGAWLHAWDALLAFAEGSYVTLESACARLEICVYVARSQAGWCAAAACVHVEVSGTGPAAAPEVE